MPTHTTLECEDSSSSNATAAAATPPSESSRLARLKEKVNALVELMSASVGRPAPESIPGVAVVCNAH
jgi:hypothetical protein